MVVGGGSGRGGGGSGRKRKRVTEEGEAVKAPYRPKEEKGGE